MQEDVFVAVDTETHTHPFSAPVADDADLEARIERPDLGGKRPRLGTGNRGVGNGMLNEPCERAGALAIGQGYRSETVGADLDRGTKPVTTLPSAPNGAGSPSLQPFFLARRWLGRSSPIT